MAKPKKQSTNKRTSKKKEAQVIVDIVTKPEPKKLGRPALYNKELADKLCKIISVTPKSVKDIVKKYKYLPKETTINKWLRTVPSFTKDYARAKKSQCDAHSEETLRIADRAKRDVLLSSEHNASALAAVAKIRIEARQWYVGKLRPKKYGDKQFIKSDNKNQTDLNVNDTSINDRLLAEVEKKLNAPIVTEIPIPN